MFVTRVETPPDAVKEPRREPSPFRPLSWGLTPDLASGGIGTADMSRKDDAPLIGDIVECAGEDLNLHGLLRPLGPQPSASTNSATSAREPAHCSRGFVNRVPRGA